MMEYAVKLKTNGTVDLISVPEQRDWEWYPRQIGCDYIEHVYPRGLEEPYMMIVDENGLLQDRPACNFYASWLYGTHMHGEPIVGDVLIMKRIMTEDGPDIGGLEKKEAEAIQRKAYDQFFTAAAAVEKALGERLVKPWQA